MEKRKLVVFIATSLDGFIARPNDDLSFLSMVQQEGEDYGYAEFMAGIDTVILGRRTYDWILKEAGELQYGDREVFVITRSKRPPEGKVVFYSGNLVSLVNTLKTLNGKNIFCDGGAEVVNELLRNDLVDELIISIIPILLGDGIRLFKDGRPEQTLKLASSKSYESGLVQVYYLRTMGSE